MNIIVFGEMGAGKDTIVDYLCDKYNYKKGKLGLEIREDVSENMRLLDIPKEEERKLLVEYGQGMRQIFGENIWIEKLLERHLEDIEDLKLCIADGRQINEYNRLTQSFGFFPIAVIANPTIRRKRLLDRDGSNQQIYEGLETEEQVRKVIKIIQKEYSPGLVIDNSYESKEELFKELDKVMSLVIA